MLENSNCDYRFEGYLPEDRQKSVKKKERKKQTNKETKPVHQETIAKHRRKYILIIYLGFVKPMHYAVYLMLDYFAPLKLHFDDVALTG